MRGHCLKIAASHSPCPCRLGQQKPTRAAWRGELAPHHIRPGPIRSPKFPRRNRIPVGPQSAAMPAGVGFGGCEFARLVPLAIAPGEAVVDHLRVDEAAGAKNPPDFAAVAVGVADLDANAVAEDFGGEQRFALGCRRLGLFRGRQCRRGGSCAGRGPDRARSECPRRRSSRPGRRASGEASHSRRGPRGRKSGRARGVSWREL